MNHLDVALDQAALSVRHNAAMDTVNQTLDDDRYELLWDVLMPSRRLLAASLEKAASDRRYSTQAAA